jgi:hypothetical protein
MNNLDLLEELANLRVHHLIAERYLEALRTTGTPESIARAEQDFCELDKKLTWFTLKHC